jgi:hypothetical protein
VAVDLRALLPAASANTDAVALEERLCVGGFSAAEEAVAGFEVGAIEGGFAATTGTGVGTGFLLPADLGAAFALLLPESMAAATTAAAVMVGAAAATGGGTREVVAAGGEIGAATGSDSGSGSNAGSGAA